MSETAVDALANDDLTWNDLTVPQLKEELTVRGLETTGKKADLIARLEQYDKGTLIGFIITSFMILCSLVFYSYVNLALLAAKYCEFIVECVGAIKAKKLSLACSLSCEYLQ